MADYDLTVTTGRYGACHTSWWTVACRPKGRPGQRVTAMARSLSMVLPPSLASELTEQVRVEVQAAQAAQAARAAMA